MARKPNFDPNSAFKSIVGEKEKKEVVSNEAEQSLIIESKATKASNKSTQKLVQRAYYITEEQYKALKILAATSDNPNEKDISAIIRNALNMYLELDKKNGR